MVRTILTDDATYKECIIYKPVPFEEPIKHQKEAKARRPRFIIKQTKKMVKEYEDRVTPRPESTAAEAVNVVRNPQQVRSVAENLTEHLTPSPELAELQSRLAAERAIFVGRESVLLEEQAQTEQALSQAVGTAREMTGMASALAEANLRTEIRDTVSQRDLTNLYNEYRSSVGEEIADEYVGQRTFLNMTKTQQIDILAELLGGVEVLGDILLD